MASFIAVSRFEIFAQSIGHHCGRHHHRGHCQGGYHCADYCHPHHGHVTRVNDHRNPPSIRDSQASTCSN